MKIIKTVNFKRASALLMAGMVALASFTGCAKKEETAVDTDIRVETTPAEYGTLEINTDYIATLSPNLTVDVVPFVAATVKTLSVKVGDRVSAGDLLCQLDDTSAELSLRSAKDAVRSARAGKDAAETQSDSARIQADGNVKSLKKALKAYKKSLKSAERQLDKLQASKKAVQKSRAASKEAMVNAKKRYKTAQALLIQFDDFLEKNPDCKTTSGLIAAASAVINPGGSNTGNVPADTNPGVIVDPADGTTESGEESSLDDNPAAKAAETKKQQAQALLAALTEAGLTVEYHSDYGLNALKEEANDSANAYTGTNSGITQLDSTISTLKTTISQLKSQIDTTEDSLESAKKLRNLASAGSEAYEAQIEAAKTGVDAASYQKDLYRLTAPIDGIVDAVNIKEENMAPQGMAAFTISEKDSMIATFYVTEDVKNFLLIGDSVALKKDEDKTEELGQITSIGTVADPQKGLFKVEAEFVTTGQKELSSGTSVKVSVVSNSVNGQLLIPYDSVYYDDGQAYVFKVVDGKALRNDVETGLFNQDYIVVESGLTAEDQIITTWASGLKDGAEVTVVNGEES